MMASTVADTYGLACPACRSDQNLLVAINCMAELSAAGTDPCGDHHWDRHSICCCHGCGHMGTVMAFELSHGEARL